MKLVANCKNDVQLINMVNFKVVVLFIRIFNITLLQLKIFFIYVLKSKFLIYEIDKSNTHIIDLYDCIQ